MIKHKEIKPDLVQSLIDLVNQYNYTRGLTATLMRNSNEIDPYPTENEGCVVGVREPYELYNENLKVLNRYSEYFKLKEETKKYLESKLDYWTPRDFVRFFRKKESDNFLNTDDPHWTDEEKGILLNFSEKI